MANRKVVPVVNIDADPTDKYWLRRARRDAKPVRMSVPPRNNPVIAAARKAKIAAKRMNPRRAEDRDEG